MSRRGRELGPLRLSGAGPTVERAAKAHVVAEPDELAGQTRARVVGPAALERYRRRGQVSARGYLAGQRLYWDTEAAARGQAVTASWQIRVDGGRPGREPRGGDDRARRALAAVGRLAPVLVAVCVEGRAAGEWAEAQGFTRQAGIAILKLALEALADHYRLPARLDGHTTS